MMWPSTQSLKKIALLVLIAGQSTLCALSSTEIVDKISGLRRLADRFSLSADQQATFVSDAGLLVADQAQMASTQAAEFKQIIEDARWGGMFADAQETELETLINSFVAGAGAIGTATVSGATAGSEGMLFNEKLDDFANKLSALGQLWYSDNARALVEKVTLMSTLASLVEELGAAFPDEIIRLEGLLNAALWNAALKSDTDSQTAITTYMTQLTTISYAMRLEHIEKIYTGMMLTPEHKERLMKHFNALIADASSAIETERKRLEDVLTFARYNQFSDPESITVIDGLIRTLASQAGAVPEGTSQEVPEAGQVVTLFSIVDNSFVHVSKPEGATTYLLSVGSDDGLGDASQFTVVKDQGRIGLRSFAAGAPDGLLVQTPAMGKPNAGKATMQTNTFPSEDKTVQFYMYGTKAEASLLNEASGGFLSVGMDKQLITIDPYTFQQIGISPDGTMLLGGNEKFKMTILSDLHVGLGKTRGQDMATAVGSFITLFGSLANADDQALYVKELERFVARIRASDTSWADFYADSSVVESFTSLLAYLSVSGNMSAHSAQIKTLQDDLTKGPLVGDLPISGIASQEDIPANGTVVALYSLWTEKDGSDPLNRYLKVFKDEASGKFYVSGSAESALDADAQFTVVREGSRIGFRSMTAGSFVLRTPPAGEKVQVKLVL